MTWQALPARPLPATSSTRTLNPRFVRYPASCDVASNICQALLEGPGRSSHRYPCSVPLPLSRQGTTPPPPAAMGLADAIKASMWDMIMYKTVKVPPRPPPPATPPPTRRSLRDCTMTRRGYSWEARDRRPPPVTGSAPRRLVPKSLMVARGASVSAGAPCQGAERPEPGFRPGPYTCSVRAWFLTRTQ